MSPSTPGIPPRLHSDSHVRVAFAGAHRTGKTTLIEAVHARLPAYDVIEEPYRLLEDDGYELSDPPTPDDFERQLRRSIATIDESGRNTLFDRCPMDFVAYLQAIEADFDVDEEVRASMEALDLIVLVPIESPDRIAVAAHEDRRLRRRVDDLLRTLLDGTDLVEVEGTVDERVAQVMTAMKT